MSATNEPKSCKDCKSFKVNADLEAQLDEAVKQNTALLASLIKGCLNPNPSGWQKYPCPIAVQLAEAKEQNAIIYDQANAENVMFMAKLESSRKEYDILNQFSTQTVTEMRETIKQLKAELAKAKTERNVLARLSSDTPHFFNPMGIFKAKQLRDRILGESKGETEV